jgi:hypothetical protein
MVAPAISLKKSIYSGHDGGASCPGLDYLVVPLQDKVTYCFTLTNVGDTYLDSITIADPDLNISMADLKPVPGSQLPPLAPGDSVSFYYETVADRHLVNHAEACANPVDAQGQDLPNLQNPCAVDSAEVAIDPSIPTLNEWGMMIFMLLASCGMVLYLRRRRDSRF